jgi:multidrug efflux pump
VVSVIGVTPLNATPNAGRIAITLRSRTCATRRSPRSSTGCAIGRAIAGIVVYFQPVQDIQISTRLSRAQYQYTLTGADPKEGASGRAACAAAQDLAGAAQRRVRRRTTASG